MALHLMLTQDEIQDLAIKERVESSRQHWREPTPEKVQKVLRQKGSVGFAPTTIQARQVESMIALGMTPAEISLALLVEEPLLRFFYKREIELGVAMVNAKVGHVALKMALKGDSPTMTQFWLTTRAGWKTTQVIEKNITLVQEASEARSKLLGQAKPLEDTSVIEDAVVLRSQPEPTPVSTNDTKH